MRGKLSQLRSYEKTLRHIFDRIIEKESMSLKGETRKNNEDLSSRETDMVPKSPKIVLRAYISRNALFTAFASDDKVRNELDQVEELKILKKTGLYQEDLAEFEDSKYKDKLSFEEFVKFL